MVKDNKQTKFSYWDVLGMVGQLGFVIAIPAAGLSYLGYILDNKYNTTPWFVIAGLGLAIFTSSMAIYRIVKKIEKETQ